MLTSAVSIRCVLHVSVCACVCSWICVYMYEYMRWALDVVTSNSWMCVSIHMRTRVSNQMGPLGVCVYTNGTTECVCIYKWDHWVCVFIQMAPQGVYTYKWDHWLCVYADGTTVCVCLYKWDHWMCV